MLPCPPKSDWEPNTFCTCKEKKVLSFSVGPSLLAWSLRGYLLYLSVCINIIVYCVWWTSIQFYLLREKNTISSQHFLASSEDIATNKQVPHVHVKYFERDAHLNDFTLLNYIVNTTSYLEIDFILKCIT